jgi:hypothetical protein
VTDATLLDEFLPVYDISDEVATVVEADARTTWDALMDADLIDIGRQRPLVAMLAFMEWNEPGFAKTIYALGTRRLADDRTLLWAVMRTATTDQHARGWFRRYWIFGVGSGAHVLVNALLDVVREDAERRSRS